jgi:hypothetical protein
MLNNFCSLLLLITRLLMCSNHASQAVIICRTYLNNIANRHDTFLINTDVNAK